MDKRDIYGSRTGKALDKELESKEDHEFQLEVEEQMKQETPLNIVLRILFTLYYIIGSLLTL